MKLNDIFRAAASATVFGALLSGCGANDVYVNRPVVPDYPDTPGQIVGQMTEFAVWGTVTDQQGNPLRGVMVTSGDCISTTDVNGYFSLDRVDVNEWRVLVRFAKEGYFPVVRSCDSNIEESGWNVALCPKNSASAFVARFDSGDSQNLSAGGMKVNLPADAYVVAATGERYEGEVEASLFYLSPEDAMFPELMPGGDLSARTAIGESVQLLSYGMAEVMLTDEDGNRLQIAEGASSDISFPTPASMSGNAPDEIPLWSFDETLGLWKQEGSAHRDATGNYSGSVSHFSWWNLDKYSERTWLDGYVTNSEGEPLSGIRVLINNQKYAVTNAEGYYRVSVMADEQFPVSVPSESYGGYQPVFKTTAGPVAYGATGRLDIQLPSLRYVYGDVTDSEGNAKKAAYEITYPGGKSKWLNTDRNGKLRYYLPLGCSGDASISVTSGTAKVEDQAFVIPYDENVYVSVVLDSSSVVPGSPDITAKCAGEAIHYLDAIRPLPSTFGGVIIEDGILTVISDFSSLDGNNFMLQVPDYNPSRVEYTNFFFSAVDGNEMVQCNSGRLTVNEQNGTYVFNLAGDGFYVVVDMESDEILSAKIADITVNNVGITHLMTIERREDYTPSSPFASFTPALSVPAPVAMVVTKSEKLGTGGFLFYNGGNADFESLVSQADRSGLDRIWYEPADEYGYAEAIYASGTSSIQMEFSRNEPEITSSSWRGVSMFVMVEDDNDEDGYPYESQIMLTSLSGGTMSLQDIQMDDDDEYIITRALKRMRKVMRYAPGH